MYIVHQFVVNALFQPKSSPWASSECDHFCLKGFCSQCSRSCLFCQLGQHAFTNCVVVKCCFEFKVKCLNKANAANWQVTRKKHLVCLPLNAIGVLTNDKEVLLILNFYRGIPTTNAPFHPFSTNPSLWQAWRTTILQYLQWNAFQSARPNLSLSQCISMLHFWRLTRLLCTAVHGYACCCARLVPGWAMQKGFAQCSLEPLRGRQELKCLTNYDKLTLRS